LMARVDGLSFSNSHTTRPPRAGERDGVDYHFVDRPRFEQLVEAGRFLEWAEVHGASYGTGRAEYERASREGLDLLLDVDVQGAAQVRAQMPDAVSVFLLPPSRAALEERLRGRGADDGKAVARRLAGARNEVARHGEYDYVLVNRDAEECARVLGTIIEASRQRAGVVEDTVAEIVRSFEI